MKPTLTPSNYLAACFVGILSGLLFVAIACIVSVPAALVIFGVATSLFALRTFHSA